MTISPRTWDTTGNHQKEDGIQLTYDTMTNVAVPPATQPSVICGTGTPTFVAPLGSLYINLTGSGIANRLFVSQGTTTWITITTTS